MKRIQSLLLLTLAIGYISAQSVLSCPAEGKFLRMIKKLSATAVLSTPNTATSTFTVCKEVWTAAGGTCCDTAALNTAFDDRMKNSLKKGFEDFMDSLKNVGRAIEKIKNINSNKDQAKTALDNARTTNAAQFGDMTSEQALETLAYAEFFKEEAEKFKTDGKTCFEAIKDASGKLFCHGCSAKQDTTNIETTDGATAIRTASCESLLTKCFSSWRFIHRVGSMMQTVAIINKRNAKSGTAPPDAQPTDKPGFGGVKMQELFDAWKNCNTAVTDSTCTEVHKANLCKANFNVGAPPKRARKENLSAEAVSQLPEKGQRLDGAAAPAKRVMQAASESTGDVAVTPTGIDLSAMVTLPTTTATVDSSSTSTGLSSTLLALSGLVGLSLVMLA